MKQIFTNNSFKWVCLIVAASLVITGLYINMRLHRYEKTNEYYLVFDKWKGEYYNVRNKIYYTDIPLNNY